MAGNRSKRDELGPDSAGQSGDIQGLSDIADADSESVEELVEEGNAFEAEAIEGVEDADDDAEDDGVVAEVTTHQVPEDDIPEEYLDNDR
jgi:N utilization substance protein A